MFQEDEQAVVIDAMVNQEDFEYTTTTPGGYRPKDQYETDSTRPISLLVSNTVSTLNRFHEDKISSI